MLMLACLISRISLSIVRLSTKNPIRGWKSWRFTPFSLTAFPLTLKTSPAISIFRMPQWYSNDSKSSFFLRSLMWMSYRCGFSADHSWGSRSISDSVTLVSEKAWIVPTGVTIFLSSLFPLLSFPTRFISTVRSFTLRSVWFLIQISVPNVAERMSSDKSLLNL